VRLRVRDRVRVRVRVRLRVRVRSRVFTPNDPVRGSLLLSGSSFFPIRDEEDTGYGFG
jgi:hypothetical protein